MVFTSQFGRWRDRRPTCRFCFGGGLAMAKSFCLGTLICCEISQPQKYEFLLVDCLLNTLILLNFSRKKNILGFAERETMYK